MTASNPNANRNGVVRILVLYVVRYAHSALYLHVLIGLVFIDNLLENIMKCLVGGLG